MRTDAKYTVIDRSGDVIARHLSAADAAKTILTDDGREWRIDGEPKDFTELGDFDDAWEQLDGWPRDLRQQAFEAIRRGESVYVGTGINANKHLTHLLFYTKSGRAVFAVNGDFKYGEWDGSRNLFIADSGEKETLGDWILSTRQQVANIGWTRTVVFSSEPERDVAEDDILHQVVMEDWARHPEAVREEKAEAAGY